MSSSLSSSPDLSPVVKSLGRTWDGDGVSKIELDFLYQNGNPNGKAVYRSHEDSDQETE